MRALYYSALAIGTVLLVGCASQSTAYYTLSMPQSATQSTMQSTTQSANTKRPAGDQATESYVLQRVTVPADVDDTTLIVRRSNDQLMVLSNDKWTASLGEVLHTALSQSLTQAIGTPPLQGVMQASGANVADTNQIIVDVQQFELQPARQSTLGVVWRINFANKNQPTLTCYSFLSAPALAGVAPLVAAQQKNVASLAQQIAFVFKNKQADKDTNCQVGA